MFRPNGLVGSVHDDDWTLVVIKTSINSKDDASVAPLFGLRYDGGIIS